MDSEPGKSIYRAMVEKNGMPQLGSSASKLGIRRNKDIVPDQAGMVHRPAFRPREKNGLSCSRSIASLPLFALPVGWGGRNYKTVVWRIEEGDLSHLLVAGDDATPGVNEHLSIGPARTMPYVDYVAAIEATQPDWKK